MKNRLIFLALSALLLTLIGCVQLKNPEIKFVGQEIRSIDIQKVSLDLNVSVYNPNGVGVDNATYGYAVTVKGVECFVGKDIPFSIPASSTVNLKLPVDIYYSKLFSTTIALMQSLMMGERTLPYEVKGSATIPFIGFPISIPFSNKGEIPLPK
jgi:LEA14-like dessication related protein